MPIVFELQITSMVQQVTKLCLLIQVQEVTKFVHVSSPLR